MLSTRYMQKTLIVVAPSIVIVVLSRFKNGRHGELFRLLKKQFDGKK